MGHGGSAGEHCRHRPMQCEGRKGHQKGHAGSQEARGQAGTSEATARAVAAS